MTLFGYRVPMTASLLVWCLLWEAVGRADLIFLVPPFSSVLASIASLVQTGGWQSATVTTATTFALGMALAIGIGVPVGVLMGRVKAVDNVLGLWVNMFVSAPLSALVPVLMILFGLGPTTVTVTVFLFAGWIIVLDARAGVRSISPSLVEMAQSFGANRWQAFSRIYVWAALPEILAGIRLGVIRAVKGVIIGQLLVSIVGFGALFKLYGSRFLMEHFWAALLVLFAFAFLLAELLGWLERRVGYYAASRG